MKRVFKDIEKINYMYLNLVVESLKKDKTEGMFIFGVASEQADKLVCLSGEDILSLSKEQCLLIKSI